VTVHHNKYRIFRNTTVSDVCWEWTGSRNECGYGTCGGDGGGSMLAHRLSYQTFCGPIPDGLEVCHTCDNRACVNPMHLFLGLHVENMRDAAQKGRLGRARGERCGAAKLTAADVLFIRSSPLGSGELAARFGVSATRICQIRKGRGWRHLPMTAAHDVEEVTA
jgi:hypothetical protein